MIFTAIILAKKKKKSHSLINDILLVSIQAVLHN